MAGPFIWTHRLGLFCCILTQMASTLSPGSRDQTIRVWSAKTGETAAGPFTGHTDWIKSVAFSPDGQNIVSGSSDRTIRVWNAMTGESSGRPIHWTHILGPGSVAFSPDGQHIVSGSDLIVQSSVECQLQERRQ